MVFVQHFTYHITKFSNLASSLLNFFAREYQGSKMDSIFVAVLGNCAIALGCLGLRGLVLRVRHQLVGLSECFDRWNDDCSWLLVDAPESLAKSREQIATLRLGYRSRLDSVEQLRAIGRSIWMIRSIVLRFR